MSDGKIYRVDRFLGINQTADSETELKAGEASRIENFTITDGYNLKRRPGVRARERIQSGEIVGLYCGYMNGEPWYCRATINKNEAQFFVEHKDKSENTSWSVGYIPTVSDLHPIKVFYMNDGLWMVGRNAYAAEPEVQVMRFVNGEPSFSKDEIYVPLAYSNGTASGSIEIMERLNILSGRFRMQCSGDGQATSFVLPENVTGVQSATVDNVSAQGSYDAQSHTYTFGTAPKNGTNNVEFVCHYHDEDMIAAREKFFLMKSSEAYNGDTDTRLFFYGDGTNICYYTGIPAFGSGLYLPAGNELSAGFSASAITGMVRHYSKLIGYQEDGAFAISYSPLTLADGTVTAGFYVRPLSREIGNQMNGQICTVNNYPRTLCNGTLYEWRSASNYLNDDRYTKAVSEKIRDFLKDADANRIVTCEDGTDKTYYMFLGDDEGTVLVNRYELDVWSVYKGDVFKNVTYATCLDGEVTFASGNTVYVLDDEQNYDDPVEKDGERKQIEAIWESGFMDFGAPNRRKYSSRIWFSLLPESASNLDITVETDKRGDYLTKTVWYSLFDFANVDFTDFSFLTRHVPQIRRIRIKVKKFVYYKLVFRVTKPGARATVLGYDQQIRFSSEVK